jgi:murein DD-endopeptidase MepM/ murein hydrolase activator NlpD
MRTRIRRVSIAATMLCTLLVPAVGSIAADQQDLDEVAEELQDLRERIDAHEEQAGSLKDQIDVLNTDLVDLQIAIQNLNDDIEEVQAKAQIAQTRIDQTQKDIDAVRELAIEQAVSLYKGGTAETLDALLSSTSLGELNDRIQMLGVAAQKNTGALVRYGRLKVTIKDQAAELFAIQQDLNSRLAAREEYEAELETKKEDLQGKLAELSEQLGAEKDHLDHKQEHYDDIRADILAAQAPTPTGVTPPSGPPPHTGSPSASGFIWPLNGGVTSPFGPRWGRMHEGIDIDGYTGQPIVASKAGTVISSGDAGDGYGTKVVIDHGGGFTTLFGHMSRLGTSGGASVSQGQVIGYVGCTGSCTGDHLHFEIRVNGGPQDPLGYLP